jgi:hypothetical protein
MLNLQLVSPANAASWTGDCVVETSGASIATIKGLECLFARLITPIPALIALIAIGMIIMAGIRLLMAGGDPKAVASAWSTFTWALIGLILLSGAWLIIVLIGKFTGAPVTTFTIPTL